MQPAKMSATSLAVLTVSRDAETRRQPGTGDEEASRT